MSNGYTLRPGTVADSALIVAQRRAMFIDMGHADDGRMAAMSERFLPWVEARLANGNYRAWIVESGGEAVAGAGLWLKEIHPGLRSEVNVVPYVLNVYARPDHRGKGLARLIMNAIVETCREEGFPTVELHASDDGRHLYETMGFVATNEMRLTF